MRWRKSSYSQSGGDCVEVAHTLDALRDSKNPTGTTLMCSNVGAFLDEVKQERWRKSSRSYSGSGDCVEVAHTLDALRDSKHSAGPALAVNDLRAFLSEVKQGRFDR